MTIPEEACPFDWAAGSGCDSKPERAPEPGQTQLFFQVARCHRRVSRQQLGLRGHCLSEAAASKAGPV